MKKRDVKFWSGTVKVREGLGAQHSVKSKAHRGRGFEENHHGKFLNGTKEGGGWGSDIFCWTSLLDSPLEKDPFFETLC